MSTPAKPKRRIGCLPLLAGFLTLSFVGGLVYRKFSASRQEQSIREEIARVRREIPTAESSGAPPMQPKGTPLDQLPFLSVFFGDDQVAIERLRQRLHDCSDLQDQINSAILRKPYIKSTFLAVAKHLQLPLTEESEAAAAAALLTKLKEFDDLTENLKQDIPLGPWRPTEWREKYGGSYGYVADVVRLHQQSIVLALVAEPDSTATAEKHLKEATSICQAGSTAYPLMLSVFGRGALYRCVMSGRWPEAGLREILSYDAITAGNLELRQILQTPRQLPSSEEIDAAYDSQIKQREVERKALFQLEIYEENWGRRIWDFAMKPPSKESIRLKRELELAEYELEKARTADLDFMALAQLKTAATPGGEVVTLLAKSAARDAGYVQHTQLAAALQLYYRKEGRYPDALTQVRSYFPRGLPLDPFTGAPHYYEKTATGYRIWGVGGNLQNEDGKGDDLRLEALEFRKTSP
jgi:hypothetical protein